MRDISNGITKKTESVVLYVLTREPNEKESVRSDLNAAVTFEGAIKTYLELRGCKKLYVNLTGYSYILRLSYVPAHCKQEDVAGELNELISDMNGRAFETYSDAFSYGKKSDDEIQKIVDSLF